MAVLVKACLNGSRAPGRHPAVPLTPPELAADAAFAAIRDACPGTPRHERATWAVLERAVVGDRDVHAGLEDTLVLADGTRARDNAELVAAAAALGA